MTTQDEARAAQINKDHAFYPLAAPWVWKEAELYAVSPTVWLGPCGPCFARLRRDSRGRVYLQTHSDNPLVDVPRSVLRVLLARGLPEDPSRPEGYTETAIRLLAELVTQQQADPQAKGDPVANAAVALIAELLHQQAQPGSAAAHAREGVE